MMPCVRVENCGYKIGLNGVNNDRIQFNQVKFPSENLLNRFGDIDKYGKPMVDKVREIINVFQKKMNI